MAVILARIITARLKDNETVLWLLSGGSAVKPAVGASKILKGQDLSRLTIGLADERYGRPGHSDSNWQNLTDKGFEFGNAKLSPVLSGESPAKTAEAYNLFLKMQLSQSGYKLALLGMGADGHTAGILPESPAVGSRLFAEYYETPAFSRITSTLKALALLDEALMYCVGANKAKALDNLEQTIPLVTQPAQIIKQIPNASVYNDIKGEQI